MHQFRSSLLVLALFGTSQAISPVEAFGPLKVVNSRLCDSTGTPRTLRGMSLYWSLHPTGYKYWNSNSVKWLQSDWNITVLRAPVGVETDAGSGNKGYLDDPQSNQDRLDRVVDAAIEAGIYLVVDWHAHFMHTDSAKAFFTRMAQKWGNTPNLIWEIWNEPNYDDAEGPVYAWSDIAEYAKAIIPEIRKYSQNPIIVGTSQYSANPQEADNSLDEFSNILYSIHFYAGTHFFRSRVSEAMSKGHAVFASEWGTTSASGSGTVKTLASEAWLDTLDAQGVSSCNWSIADLSETSAALVSGASPAGNWDPATELKASGAFVRNLFLQRNIAPDGARFTAPDSTTRILEDLKSSTYTLSVTGQDTARLTAKFSKVTNWTLTLTGLQSGAIFTASGNLSTQVDVKWAATMKKAFTSKTFQNGELVQAVLTPAGNSPIEASTTTLGIGVASVAPKGVLEPAHWTSQGLALPLLGWRSGAPATIRWRNLEGRIQDQSETVIQSGAKGVFVPLARPSTTALRILELHSEGRTWRGLVPALSGD
ncbi:MAG: glycoside hydrolase family 5 protein [Fibrobacteria bacterium]|nr:glycoside hydrolase family 5 protein [Fibrobacteria bacterium]